MGYWGTGLYDNDIALDTKDIIHDILENALSDLEVKQRVIKCINDLQLDEDERCIAWLVAADCLLSNFEAQKMYKNALNYEEKIDQKTIEEEIKKGKGYLLRRKNIKSYVTKWNYGDVYLLNISSDFENNIVFREYTWGLYCVDMYYEYDGSIFPIAYVFRSKNSPTELSCTPDLVLKSTFWRIANFKEKGYTYRIILISRKIKRNRIQYCCHLNKTPLLNDEFIVLDKASNSRFYWPNFEEHLLKTYSLQ